MKTKKAIVGIYVSCLHTGHLEKYTVIVERKSKRMKKSKKRTYNVSTMSKALDMISAMSNDGKLTNWIHLSFYPTMNFRPVDYDILTGKMK